MSTTLSEPMGIRDEDLPDAGRRTASILEQARRGSPASASAAPRPARALAWLRATTFALRRGHLYAGLFLLPWVFLYGITGFLFNHPTWFADVRIIPFGPAETRGTALDGLPTPAEIAGQVVAALNARGDGGYRLVAPRDARYERGGLTATVIAGDGKSYSVTVNPDGDGGLVREAAAGARGGVQATSPPAATRDGRREGREGGEAGARSGAEAKGEGRTGRAEGRAGRGDAPASPLDVREGLTLAGSPLPQLERGLPAVLAKVGLLGVRIAEVRAAPLAFQVEGGGRRWLVSYAMPVGSVTARLVDPATATELSSRRFLTAMHLTHGYPSTFGARWAWAVIVDVMSGIMVFWGVSGIVMWWQIKRTRRLGAVVLALSVVAALGVGLGMHEALSAGGR